jgi:hypothetical protein
LHLHFVQNNLPCEAMLVRLKCIRVMGDVARTVVAGQRRRAGVGPFSCGPLPREIVLRCLGQFGQDLVAWSDWARRKIRLLFDQASVEGQNMTPSDLVLP